MSLDTTVPVDQGQTHRGCILNVDLITLWRDNAGLGPSAAKCPVVYPMSTSSTGKDYSVLAGDACFIKQGQRQDKTNLRVISTFNGACVPLGRRARGLSTFLDRRRALADDMVFVGVAATNIWYTVSGGTQDPTQPVIKINGITQVNNVTGETIPAGAYVRVRLPLKERVMNPKMQGWERDWVKAEYVKFDLTDVFPSPLTLRENLQIDRDPSNYPGQGDPEKEDAPYHASIQTMIQTVAYLAIHAYKNYGTETSIERFVGLANDGHAPTLDRIKAKNCFGDETLHGYSTSKALIVSSLGMTRKTAQNLDVPNHIMETLMNAFNDMFAHNQAAIQSAMSNVAGRALSTGDPGHKFDIALGHPNI